MQSIAPFRSLLLISVVLSMAVVGSHPVFAVAADPSSPKAAAATTSSDPTSSDQVVVGIDGLFRVGHWTAIRLVDESVITRVRTEDGDGVTVSYVQSAESERETSEGFAYAIAGSEEAPLVLQRTTGDEIRSRFPAIGSPDRGPTQVPLAMPWIVSIGEPIGVDRIGANEILGRDPTVAVSQPKTAAALPDSVLGYDGVDMIMIGGSGTDLLSEMTASQQTAISDWIIGGGHAFVRIGESLAAFERSAPWLLELLPEPAGGWMTVQIDPSAVETYTSTQTPLQSFIGARLPKTSGETVILGRTTRRVSTPVAARYVTGLGRITVVAADLEDAPFADWPDRLDLIKQLTGSLLQSDDTPVVAVNRATAYDDLGGQMRASLDQFATQRRFSFSVVSLVLLSLIALIGPLDYLLINRLLGRPLLGWLSFPAMAISISIVLVLQSRPVSQAEPVGQAVVSDTSTATKADRVGPEAAAAIHAKRIEFVDIDSSRQYGRAFSWSVLYSHDARRLDIASMPGGSLEKLSRQINSVLTTPYGFPGRPFGAIQVTGESLRLPSYEVLVSKSTNGKTAAIRQVPLAPRSSKSVATMTYFDPQVANDLSMRRRGGSELLEGSFHNPLPVDLLNGMLVYRNWAYLLPTRFPAGGQIETLDSLRQKNFRWQLSRQKALESATETEAWNPSMTDSPERIAEMLMFHDVVGGSRYTRLQHEVLSFLDFSDLLTSERCILVGRLESPVTELQLGSSTNRPPANSLTESTDTQTTTLLRLVMPVTTTRSW